MTKETLEEAATRYTCGWGENDDEKAFMNGAKWQAERMFSDEEVIDLLAKFRRDNRGKDFIPFKDIQEWFEQFKKK
jgi:hypothetical protein